MEHPNKPSRGVSGGGASGGRPPASRDSLAPAGSRDTALLHDTALLDATVLLNDAPERELTETVVTPALATPFPIANLNPAALAAISQRYDVLGEAGHGSMGNVYKARDRETGETVALKLLKPEIASDQAMMERFKNELLFARKITHKNVCRMHEFNRVGGIAYTTMEFVEGESLRSVLNRFGGLPQRKALGLALQICSGLKEAHAQGIVHRDLKPENIMVDANGNVKIMDFGIARSMDAVTRMTGSIVGTPQYMAPEQVGGKPVDYRTDIYSLGLILYEMFTGTPAFQADNPVAVALKQMQEEAVPPHEIDPAIPAYIERTILKCLLKNPANRFQSIAQLEQALNGSEPQNLPGVIPPARTATPQKAASVHATGRMATPAVMPATPTRKGTSPIIWALLGAVVVLVSLALLNGIAKKTAEAEMIPPPSELPAPVPPDFAYAHTPQTVSEPVAKEKPAEKEPTAPPPSSASNASNSLPQVAPFTHYKPETPRMENWLGRKRPSPDAAAATLRADAAASKAGRKAGKNNAASAAEAATPETASDTAAAGAAGASYLLVGRYQREDRAQETEKKIEGLGLPAGVVTKHWVAGNYYLVYSGPFTNAQVGGAMQKLEEKGFLNVRTMAIPETGKNAIQ